MALRFKLTFPGGHRAPWSPPEEDRERWEACFKATYGPRTSLMREVLNETHALRVEAWCDGEMYDMDRDDEG